MAHVTLLCGPAGAGKSTLARSLEDDGAVVLSFDREAWARGVHDGRPSRRLMAEIDAELAERLRIAVGGGHRVVVDASMSARWVRDVWRARADAAGASHELVVLRAPLATLVERVRAREPGPESVVMSERDLRAYVTGFEWPTADESHEERWTADPDEEMTDER